MADRPRTLTVHGAGEGRAVSDAVGYVLVFSLIVTTMGVVYVGGYESLLNTRDYRQMENAERAFEVLSVNVRDITRRSAPSRTTEIQLSGNELEYADSINVSVSVHPTGQPGDKWNVTNVSVRPLVLRAAADRAVYYSNGAIFRESSGGTSMSKRPGMVLTESRLVVPIVKTRALDNETVGGDTTVAIRTILAARSQVVSNSSETTMWLNVSGERADAWRRYVDRNTEDSWAECPDAVNTDTFAACRFTGVEEVFVSRIVIDVDYVA